ncbi:MAG: hypothetical protein ACLPGW_06210 [Roseiarcus sp.]
MNEIVMREPGRKPRMWILVVLLGALSVALYASVILKIVKFEP